MTIPQQQPDERFAQLQHGIVYELQRRLGKEIPRTAGSSSAAEDHTHRTVDHNGTAAKQTDLTRPLDAIEAGLSKLITMRDCIRQHEETIHDLRKRCIALEHERENDRRTIEDLEVRCREESERARRGERLVELLEQKNARFESDSDALNLRLQSLLGLISQV